MKLPRGFGASGVRAGLKKQGTDLAVIVAKGGANAAAVFTRNKFQAAPVVLSKKGLTASRGRVKVVVVNAGCANAITGPEGEAAAGRVRQAAAALAGCPQNEVFVASTGVIGVVLPDDRIREALPGAFEALSEDGLEPLSEAIMTTDNAPKVAEAAFMWNGKRARLTGVAKGAGMIHPDMATMLAFLMTDAPATPGFLAAALSAVNAISFNAISVDGDTSTNDTVLLMSSGALAGEPMTDPRREAPFLKALTKVCRELAWKIVRDGEGASRVMEITVRGARTEKEARAAAHAIGTSPLVKTALNGGDPNWGRILAAVGRSGVALSTAKVSLRAGKLWIVKDGAPTAYEEAAAAKVFALERVPLTVDLGVGSASAVLLAADLGHGYVSVNADYRS
ncbi:MAG: bifunctional glutamate N-acetyltransferase/amino-acid acetyltransferase ArgJ [Acidobacteria bacterium]|nr:bifunctional glutamate N-acetyltransferase/amino-acid acetyltransferase ArgJ [Acidobacteriota bacterium]MCK6685064.1 bifunctional glutamate N-acetyltransferase/amino-acid acetyltransferase ArgJ [Thermoanaerobaculia bacterium]